MTRVPVSREKFESILSQGIEALTPEILRTYELYAVPLYKQKCVRGADYGHEEVFVVARNGTRFIYYDDIEEDFGVSVADGDGVLRDWENYGPLLKAVLVLSDEAHIE
jgi:hypothetical protein